QGRVRQFHDLEPAANDGVRAGWIRHLRGLIRPHAPHGGCRNSSRLIGHHALQRPDVLAADAAGAVAVEEDRHRRAREDAARGGRGRMDAYPPAPGSAPPYFRGDNLATDLPPIVLNSQEKPLRWSWPEFG